MAAAVLALLLADGRFPAGGHAHSGGMEQAVDEGAVTDLVSLEAFLAGRLATVGRVEAHASALSCAISQRRQGELFAELDEELDARMASPVARRASRRQGAQFLRASASVLAHPALEQLGDWSPAGPHLCVAIGVASHAAGCDPCAAAAISLYQSCASQASAGLRLLGLDPLGVAGVLARLGSHCEELAARAGEAARDGPRGLPGGASPILDLLHELHGQRQERLFAS